MGRPSHFTWFRAHLAILSPMGVTTGEGGASGGDAVDTNGPAAHALDIGRDGHLVAGERLEPLRGKVPPTRISEQTSAPAAAAARSQGSARAESSRA